MCLERSYPAPLEVIVDVRSHGPARPSCTCINDGPTLIPNERKPCEWHFVFESLTETRHSKRTHALDILFETNWPDLDENRVEFAPRSCRFFNLPALQLTSLKCQTDEIGFVNQTFPAPAPPFVPTLRSLTFIGYWNSKITELNNLTSFAFDARRRRIDAESFRMFILHNRSLETLSLGCVKFKGNSNGPPAVLSNLKSFNVYYSATYSHNYFDDFSSDFFRGSFSTLFRVPALQRLSSLSISITEVDNETCWFTLYATGDDIAFTVICDSPCIAATWSDLTGGASPPIRHARLKNPGNFDNIPGSGSGRVVELFMDAHTLEIDDGFASFFPDFWEDLKERGPRLKTIRFAVPEGTEPLQQSEEDRGSGTWEGTALNRIEELVVYRFEHGRPFSSVERMIVSESEEVNRQQDSVWRRFYSVLRNKMCYCPRGDDLHQSLPNLPPSRYILSGIEIPSSKGKECTCAMGL